MADRVAKVTYSALGSSEMDLSAYRAAVGGLLGGVADWELWPEAVLDAALREALREYDEAAPPVECNLTVLTAGYEQDLSPIGDVLRVAGLAWPWHDSAQYVPLAQRWQLVDDLVVRLLDGRPAAGDVLRVRYWRRHAIDGLDSAICTTVRLADERLVCRGAAGWAAHIRARQLIELEDAPTQAAERLWRWQELALGEWRRGLDQLAGEAAIGGGGGVSWGSYGL